MLKRKLSKRIVSIGAAAGLAIGSTLMASASSFGAPLGYDYVSGDSSISYSYASASTHYSGTGAVQVSSTYEMIKSGVVRKQPVKSDDKSAPTNSAYVSFIAPAGAISYYISSSHIASSRYGTYSTSTSARY